MQATDLIRIALNNSRNWAMGLLMDMKDAPLTQPTDRGGNHPLWVLGHLTHSESQLLDVFLLGKENRFRELEAQFGMSSVPTTNPADYPSFDELLEKNEVMRAAVLEHLDTLNDANLDQQTHAPEEYAAYFGTTGAVFSSMTTHYGFHAGQVADARRANGRDPLMA